ncbi:MAG: CDP-glycerol glycerophosphotransferase family protein [Candidatus Hodarchaeota archaeon]
MISNDHFINTIIGTKLDCDKTLIELTRYQGVYLWWFVDRDFRYFSAKILRKFSKKIHNETFFRIYGRFDFLLDIVRHFSTKILPSVYQDKKKNDRKILITDQHRQWDKIIDLDSFKSKKSDAFFDSIISRLKSTYEIVGIYPLGYPIGTRPNKGIKIFIDKLLNWDIRYTPFESFWSIPAWREGRRASSHFKDIWKSLKDDKGLKKACQNQQRNLDKILSRRLKFYFYVMFPMFVKYIEMAKQMIKAEEPDLLLLLNEYSYFERALVVAGKLRGVPTLAVQHGVMIPEFDGGSYIFDKDFKDQVILPNKMCVFGPYYQKLLVEESIFDQNQVIVTGAPRYDILSVLPKFASRKEILSNLGVNTNHQIILWTTQCHGMSLEENITNFKTMGKVMGEFQGITLVVKQHPNEGIQYSELIKNFLLAEDQSRIVVVPKTSNTYDLLIACDLLLTKSSTTALEAIALNKPLLILDLSGKESPIEFVQEGVAIPAYDEENLKEAIKQLLSDDSALAAKRTKYIESRLHRIDGKATDRIVDSIISLIK